MISDQINGGEVDWSDIAASIPASGLNIDNAGTLVLVPDGEASIRLPASHASDICSAVLWLIHSELDMASLAKVSSAATGKLKDMILDAFLADALN